MPLYTCAFEASQTERVEVVELDFVLALSTQCEIHCCCILLLTSLLKHRKLRWFQGLICTRILYIHWIQADNSDGLAWYCAAETQQLPWVTKHCQECKHSSSRLVHPEHRTPRCDKSNVFEVSLGYFDFQRQSFRGCLSYDCVGSLPLSLYTIARYLYDVR